MMVLALLSWEEAEDWFPVWELSLRAMKWRDLTLEVGEEVWFA